MRRSSSNIPPQRALQPEPPQQFAEEGQDGFDKAHQHFSASRRFSKQQENVTNNSYWNIPSDRWKSRQYPQQYSNANPHWPANSVGGHGVMQTERQYPDSSLSASSSYNYYGGYYDQYQYQQYQQSAGSGNMRTCDGNTGLGNPSSGAVDQQRRQTRSAYDTPMNTGSFGPRLMSVKREQDSEVLDAEGDNFGSIFTKSLTSLYSQDAENAYADQSDPDIIICDSVTNSEDSSYQRLGPPNQYHNTNINRGNFGYYDGNRPDGLQHPPVEDGNQVQMKNSFRYDRPSFDDMHLYTNSQNPGLSKSQQAKKRKMSTPNFPADGFQGGENRNKKQPKMLSFKSDSKWTPNACSFPFGDVVIKEEPLDDYPCEEEPANPATRKPAKEAVPFVKPANNQESPKTLPRKRSPAATCFDKFDKSSSKTSKKVSPLSAYAKVQDSIVLSLKCRRYKKRTKAVVGKDDGYHINDTDTWKRNGTGVEQAVRHVIGELLDRVSPCGDRRVSDLPEFSEIGIHRIRELLYQFCQRYALDYNDFEDIEKVMKPCMFIDKPETSERTRIRKRTSTSPIQVKQESVKPTKAVVKKVNETLEKRVLRSLPSRDGRERQTRRRGGKTPTVKRRYSTRSSKGTDNEDAGNSDAEIIIDSSSDRESCKEEDTKGTKKSKRMMNKANDTPEKFVKPIKNEVKDEDSRRTKHRRNDSETEVSQKDIPKRQQRRKWARVSKYSSDSSQSSLNDEMKNVMKKGEGSENSRVSRSADKVKTAEKTKVSVEKSESTKASGQVKSEGNEKKVKATEKVLTEKLVEELRTEKQAEKLVSEKSSKKSGNEKNIEKPLPEKISEKSNSEQSVGKLVPGKSLEKSSAEKVPEKTISEKPSEKSSSEKPSEKLISEKLTEKSSSGKSCEKSFPNKSSEKSSSEKSCEKSFPDKSSEKSMLDKSSKKLLSEKSPEKIAEETGLEKPFENPCPKKTSDKLCTENPIEKSCSPKPPEISCIEKSCEKSISVVTSVKPLLPTSTDKESVVAPPEITCSVQHPEKASLKKQSEKMSLAKPAEKPSIVVTSEMPCLITPAEEKYSEKSTEEPCIIKQYENTCLEKVPEKPWLNEPPQTEHLENTLEKVTTQRQYEKESLGKLPKKMYLENPVGKDTSEKLFEESAFATKESFEGLSDIARLEMLAETACLEQRAQTVCVEKPIGNVGLEKPYFDKTFGKPYSDKASEMPYLEKFSGKSSSDMTSERSYLKKTLCSVKSFGKPTENISESQHLEKPNENVLNIDPFGSVGAKKSSEISVNSHTNKYSSVAKSSDTFHNVQHPSEQSLGSSKRTLGKFHALNSSENPNITQVPRMAQQTSSGNTNEERTGEKSLVMSATENPSQPHPPKKHQLINNFEKSSTNQTVEQQDKWKSWKNAFCNPSQKLSTKLRGLKPDKHNPPLHPSAATKNEFINQMSEKPTTPSYRPISKCGSSTNPQTEKTSESSFPLQTSQNLEKSHVLENPPIAHAEASSFERRGESATIRAPERVKTLDTSGHPHPAYKYSEPMLGFSHFPTAALAYEQAQAKAASEQYSNISKYYLGSTLLSAENDMFLLQNAGKVGVSNVQRPIPLYCSRPMMDAMIDAPPFLRKMDTPEPDRLQSPNSRWRHPSQDVNHLRPQFAPSGQKAEGFVRCTSAPAPMQPKRQETLDVEPLEPLSLTVDKRQLDNKSSDPGPPQLDPNSTHGSVDSGSQAEASRYCERPHSIPSDYLYKTDFSSTLSGIQRSDITNVLFNSIGSFRNFEKGAFEAVTHSKQSFDGTRDSKSVSKDEGDSRKEPDADQETRAENTKNEEPIDLGKPPELTLMTTIKKECTDDLRTGDSSRQSPPSRNSKEGESSASKNPQRRKSLSKRKDSKSGGNRDRSTFSESDDSDGELVIDLDRGQVTSEDRNPASSPKPSTSHADPEDHASLKSDHGGGCSHWEDDDDCVILTCGASDKSRSEKSAKDTNESILRTLLLERGELMNTSSSSQDVVGSQNQHDEQSNSLPEIDYAAAANQEVLKLISELRHDGASSSSSIGLGDGRRAGGKLSPCCSSNGDSLVVTEESLDCSNLDPQRLLKVLIMKLNYEICLLHCLAEQKEQERSALMSYKRDKERILERLLKQYFLNVQDDVHDDLQDHVRDWIMSRNENSDRNSSSKDPVPTFRLPPSESQGAPPQQRPSHSQGAPPMNKVDQPSTSSSPSLQQHCWGEKLPTVETLIAKATENYGVDMKNIQSSSSATATTTTSTAATATATSDQNILMKVLLANENTSTNLPATATESTSKPAATQPTKPPQKAHSKQYSSPEHPPQNSNRNSKETFTNKAIPKVYESSGTNVPYDYSTSSENRGKSKPYDIPKMLASCEYTPHFENRASSKHYDTTKSNPKCETPLAYDRTMSVPYNSSKTSSSHDYRQGYDQRTASKAYAYSAVMPCEYPPGFDSRTSMSTNYETSDASTASNYFPPGFENSTNGHHPSSSMKPGEYEAKDRVKHASPNSAYWSIQTGSKVGRGDTKRVEAVKREHVSPPLSQSESSSKKRSSKHAFPHPSKMSSGVSVKSEPSHQRSLKSSVERIYNRKSEEERRALAYQAAALPAPKNEGAYGVLNLAPPGQISVPNQMRPMASPRCMTCGTIDAKFICSGCGKHWYCSTHCQTLRWPEHSRTCSGLANYQPF